MPLTDAYLHWKCHLRRGNECLPPLRMRANFFVSSFLRLRQSHRRGKRPFLSLTSPYVALMIDVRNRVGETHSRNPARGAPASRDGLEIRDSALFKFRVRNSAEPAGTLKCPRTFSSPLARNFRFVKPVRLLRFDNSYFSAT